MPRKSGGNHQWCRSPHHPLIRSTMEHGHLAEETAELVRQQILQQTGIAVLAQANIRPQMALNLLEGG